MDITTPEGKLSIPADLVAAVKRETEKFLDYYLWLENAMPSLIF